MTTIGHIMIGATITAVFSIYTILNICEYVTDQQKYLVTHYDRKIRNLTEQIDLLSAEINNISFSNTETNSATNSETNNCFELTDVYNEYNEVIEFTNEQLQLLLEVSNNEAKEEEENTNMGFEDQDADITLVNVNEETDEDIVQVPELIDIDDEKDVKRVQDSLLVIARKAILGV